MSEQKLEASFSTLVVSIASSAAMALGMAPNPVTNKVEKDINMAHFNIELLRVLKDKTANNLSESEGQLLEQVIGDLQMKYVQAQKA